MDKLEFNVISKENVIVEDDCMMIDGNDMLDLVRGVISKYNELGMEGLESYLEDVLYGNLEGFEVSDKVGILRLLKDMYLYKG